MKRPLVAMLLGCLLWAGCGPAAKPTGNLQGAVTFDGTPVKDATVQIQSLKSGEAFAAKVDAGGKFVFKPVTTGEYNIAVIPTFEAPVAGASKEPPPKPTERKDIPERYRTSTKSGFKVEVKPGDNTFDAKMTK